MKKLISLILFLAFAAIAFVLHLKNPDAVTFSFPFIELQLPLGLLILVALLIGMVLGALLMSFSLLRLKLDKSKANRQLKKVEKEVANLKSTTLDN